MYLYSFTQYAGFDRVFNYQWLEKKLNFSEGDLILLGEEYFLVLGDEIAFQELYHTIPTVSGKVQVVFSSLLSSQSLKLLHWMTYWRYSPYKNIVKYFLPKEIAQFLKRKPTLKNNKITQKSKKTNNQTKKDISKNSSEKSLAQSLFIFPDLRTLYNTIDQKSEILTEKKENIILYSQATQNQKDRAWREIKTWKVKNIYCTHAEIFQDFCNLGKIVQVAPHKRYYANQQDPRYKTWEVVKKMKEIWEIGE